MGKNNKILIPTSIVIFGATGDLVRKKIIGSLLRLYSFGYLPEKFRIIGVSRRDYSDEVFREFLKIRDTGPDAQKQGSPQKVHPA